MVKKRKKNVSIVEKLDAAFHESQINTDINEDRDLAGKEIGSTGITDGILNNAIGVNELTYARKTRSSIEKDNGLK